MNPFLHGRKNASGAALVAPQTCTPVRLPGMVRSTPAPEAGPSVDVVKEGGKIVRIVVKCSCGELLEIECLYSA